MRTKWEGPLAWALLGAIAIACAGGSGSSRPSEPARKVSMDDTEYETDPMVARSIPKDRARETLKGILDSLAGILDRRDIEVSESGYSFVHMDSGKAQSVRFSDISKVTIRELRDGQGAVAYTVYVADTQSQQLDVLGFLTPRVKTTTSHLGVWTAEECKSKAETLSDCLHALRRQD